MLCRCLQSQETQLFKSPFRSWGKWVQDWWIALLRVERVNWQQGRLRPQAQGVLGPALLPLCQVPTLDLAVQINHVFTYSWHLSKIKALEYALWCRDLTQGGILYKEMWSIRAQSCMNIHSCSQNYREEEADVRQSEPRSWHGSRRADAGAGPSCMAPAHR